MSVRGLICYSRIHIYHLCRHHSFSLENIPAIRRFHTDPNASLAAAYRARAGKNKGSDNASFGTSVAEWLFANRAGATAGRWAMCDLQGRGGGLFVNRTEAL